MILIKNGLVVNCDASEKNDILLQNGKIKEIGKNITYDEEVKEIDAEGLLVLPGGIDTHTHMSLFFMGSVSADDFFSGTRAALAGGTTTIIDFVNPKKEETLLEGLNKWFQLSENEVCCDYSFHMIVRKWDDQVARDMETLVKEKGINSFKCFMAYKGDLMVTDSQMIQIFKRCQEIGAIAMVHAENGDLIEEKSKKIYELGITGPEGHALSRPEDIEGEATHRAITIGNQVNCPVYIVHVMSKSACDVIKEAQFKGSVVIGEPIAASLALDGSHYRNSCWRHAAGFVLSPPLREDPQTPSYLMNHLATGSLSVVGTDHAVFKTSQKALGKDDFRKIPNGINGVEERMAVLWKLGVVSGKMSANRFVEVTSSAAAKIFGFYPQKGRIAVGSDADIVLWDPKASKTISASTHHSNVDFNIFEGFKCEGLPKYVISRGVLVYDQGKLNVTKGSGKFVKCSSFPSYVYDRILAKKKNNIPKKVERKPYTGDIVKLI